MTLAEPHPDRRQQLGRDGEAAAARALVRSGLTILERRYRCRAGEIDLVAERGELLVFVEVKARAGTGYGAPAAAVTARKRRRMARVANDYLARTGGSERVVRFDVVEVTALEDGTLSVNHIDDAFRIWPTG